MSGIHHFKIKKILVSMHDEDILYWVHRVKFNRGSTEDAIEHIEVMYYFSIAETGFMMEQEALKFKANCSTRQPLQLHMHTKI